MTIEHLLIALASQIPHTPGLRPAPKAEDIVDLYSAGYAAAETLEGQIIGYAVVWPLEASACRPLVYDGSPVGFLDPMWLHPDLEPDQASTVQRKLTETLLQRHRDTHVLVRMRHQGLVEDRAPQHHTIGGLPKHIRREVLRITAQPGKTRRELQAIADYPIILVRSTHGISGNLADQCDGFHVQPNHVAF